MEEPGRSIEMGIPPRPQRIVHLIPGISGTASQWSGIHKALEKAELNGGKLYDRVITHDSSVTTKGYDPEHFKKIAQPVVTDLKAGKSLDFLVTSLAATDLMQIFRSVEEITDDPDFFNNPEIAKKIRLILISPWGLVEGVPEELFQPRRFGELLQKRKEILQAFSLVTRFAGLLKDIGITGLVGSREMGIMSLQMILPDGINPSALTSTVTAAYSKSSQKIEGQEIVKTLSAEGLRDQSNEYWSQLKSNDQDKLAKIDPLLKAAVEKEDLQQFRDQLEARGKVLNQYILNILGGKEINSEEPIDLSQLRRGFGQLAHSFLKNAPAIIKSTATGEVYHRLLALKDAGVSLHFLLPEYDQIVLDDDINKFVVASESREKGQKPGVTNLLSNTHTSSYSFNLQALVNGIKSLS